MKILPPQPNIKIYETGFDKNDLLDRSDASRRLSSLLEHIDDPIVIALDGPWGSGKSYFLKRWVAAHTLENKGLATTVYFDAFAHDYLEDPLIALTGAIGERLPRSEEKDKWKTAKTAAYRLSIPALRMGLAIATVGTSEIAGPVLNAALESGSKDIERAAEDFWRREDGRRVAMESFKAALIKVTSPSEKNQTGRPLIVVIDELDRCRPDYALNMLEVIKHFFTVTRVHFVLGTNMDALKHIVRARYGSGIDAENYLKRFISLSMHLPNDSSPRSEKKVAIAYFENSALEMGIAEHLIDQVTNQIKLAGQNTVISLRDIEKILTRLAILPRRADFHKLPVGYQVLISSLVVIQTMRSDLMVKAMNETLTVEEVDKFFGISEDKINRNSEDSSLYHHESYITHGIWNFVISNKSVQSNDPDQFARSFGDFGFINREKIISRVCKDYFSIFELIGD